MELWKWTFTNYCSHAFLCLRALTTWREGGRRNGLKNVGERFAYKTTSKKENSMYLVKHIRHKRAMIHIFSCMYQGREKKFRIGLKIRIFDADVVLSQLVLFRICAPTGTKHNSESCATLS